MATMKEIQEFEKNRNECEEALKSDIEVTIDKAIRDSFNIAGVDDNSAKRLGLIEKIDRLAKTFSLEIYNELSKIKFVE